MRNACILVGDSKAVIVGIVFGMWLLTYFDKVSGDSFVFVIGALLGYIFAFLERFLGILTHD